MDERLDAVLTRDERSDGSFVYGVTTTGIYCRPGCPARRPRPEHIVLFDDPQRARSAGFRACRRCRPDEVTPHQLLVARVKAAIDAADDPTTLSDLARIAGASPHHLQRVFRRSTGLTPKQYAQATKSARLDALLASGDTVAGAGYQAGYGSQRALYQEGARALGMTPGARAAGGAGVHVAYDIVDTRLGRMAIAASDRGVAALHLGSDDGALLRALTDELPGAELTRDAAAVGGHVEAVHRFLAGPARGLDLPLDLRATEFQREVWRALAGIPPGHTRTYGEVAAAIGRPGAARAVARACAANPVALAIPCHRVVRRGSRESGYRWGRERKRQLLELEAVSEPAGG